MFRVAVEVQEREAALERVRSDLQAEKEAVAAEKEAALQDLRQAREAQDSLLRQIQEGLSLQTSSTDIPPAEDDTTGNAVCFKSSKHVKRNTGK